jgi:hypothetical protein
MRAIHAATIAAALLLTAVPSATADQMGADWVSSDNVEYLGSLKEDVGLTTGARVIGNRLFVTSAKNISIYDISTPESPQRLGSMALNLSWENEEVPTNGKVLAFASDFFNAMPSCGAALAVTGCVQFFDVRDPENIREVGYVPIANHTAECALDCQFLYGSSGTIIDARGVLDGKEPTVLGDWKEALATQGVESQSCHHIRELRPGVLLTACQPFSVITINPKDARGASPATPKVLYTGEAEKFVHSARWPRRGSDKFVLTGGELNFTGRCEMADSEFSTYSAEAVNDGDSRTFEGPLFQKPPAPNGTYVDGRPPANHLGCSVHWFQEHPTFKNGGLVALSEYENGVRFLQIHRDGSIEEQGFFAALGSSSSSPKWAPSGDVLYSIDYDRGIDIMRWTGQHYVPKGKSKGVKKKRGRVRGTNGTTTVPRLTRRQAASRDRLGARLRARGWSPGLCRLIAQRSS